RSGVRRRFGVKSKRVGFVDLIVVVPRYHMIFVGVARPDFRNEAFPNSGRSAWMKKMSGIIPSIERTHHGDFRGIGCPNSEIHSVGSVDLDRMGTEPVVQFDVAAFVKQVEIVIAEQRHEKVPRQLRPFFEFARDSAGQVGASWGALYWL